MAVAGTYLPPLRRCVRGAVWTVSGAAIVGAKLARPAAAPPLATTNSALNLTPATPISPTEPAPLPPPPLRRARSQTQTLSEGRRRGTGRGRPLIQVPTPTLTRPPRPPPSMRPRRRLYSPWRDLDSAAAKFSIGYPFPIDECVQPLRDLLVRIRLLLLFLFRRLGVRIDYDHDDGAALVTPERGAYKWVAHDERQRCAVDVSRDGYESDECAHGYEDGLWCECKFKCERANAPPPARRVGPACVFACLPFLHFVAAAFSRLLFRHILALERERTFRPCPNQRLWCPAARPRPSDIGHSHNENENKFNERAARRASVTLVCERDERGERGRAGRA
ncbi:hypothetical protein B0H14DRAFT_3482327 [Mycena olivaceomarginata]|nr:hypothetical protein B0H14DRAFT_3482327 [Mycena olivaceomarginata]